jgi:hypothetical protein
MLDLDFYNKAEVDRSLTGQATVIVIVATAFGGVGSAIAQEDASVIAGAVGGVIAGVIGWLLWSLGSWLIGTRVFDGDATFGAMVRVIGFAFAPFVIGVIPWLGFPAAIWVFIATIVAFREGLDISTARALGTMAVGWGLWLGSTVLLNLLLDLQLNARWPFP